MTAAATQGRNGLWNGRSGDDDEVTWRASRGRESTTARYKASKTHDGWVGCDEVARVQGTPRAHNKGSSTRVRDGGSEQRGGCFSL